MAANGLGLTQIPQISLNCTPDVKSHGGWQIGHGACRSTPISKNHTDFKNNLWKFVIICGSFLTTNFTNRTNDCFCWISLNLCEPLQKIPWDFPPTKAKTVRSAGSVWALGAKVRKNSVRFPTHQSKNREIREICVRHRISCGIFGLCGEILVT